MHIKGGVDEGFKQGLGAEGYSPLNMGVLPVPGTLLLVRGPWLESAVQALLLPIL